MSTILARTISSVVDKRAVLTNSQFARALPFGTTWSSIRIGIRWHTRDIGVSTAAENFCVGLCSGSTNLVGDATTDNWCGMRTNSAGFRTSTTYRLSPRPSKKVGATFTDGSAFSGLPNFDVGHGAATPAADRTLLFVDITKGSPNYTFRVFANVAEGPSDRSLFNFLTQMEAATPSISEHALSSNQTLAVDESGGVFNHVNISWGITIPEIEICDLAVARFA